MKATVESVERRDSLAWLRLGRGRLAARLWEGITRGQRVEVEVRPEDVLLCAEHPGRVSARNVIAGHVRSLRGTPEGVYVTVEAGFPLVAMVTRSAVRDLRLRRGASVYAVVKATAIVRAATVKAAVRAAVVGRRGTIGHERLDFLRALARTGSLSVAARAVGVTFRTAWMWAESANRDWGAPVVACRRGGRGGGGAVLTPEGRAMLRLADRAERR
jgi:molybdate transport system regulatory protein